MNNKKKITLVTTRFPWPLTNGFANKNYWLIRGLSKKFDIDLYVIQHYAVTKSDIAQIESFCKEIKIFRPSPIDIVIGIVISLLRDWPFQLALYRSSRAMACIRNSLVNANLAFVSVIRSIQYVYEYHGPIVCDFADSLGQIYTRDACHLPLFKRWVYMEEGRRMAKYEKLSIRRVSQALFFNFDEVKYYESSNISLVPHGVNPDLFEIEDIDSACSDGVVIFGKMNFEPNVQSVFWFVNYVLDKLPGHIKLYVIGADPSAHLLRLAKENPRVKVLGFIENPYPLIRGAIANISPIQMGGGIQNKVIEGLAIGALGILSPLAAIPMKDIEKSGLVVCKTTKDWVETIIHAYVEPRYYDSNRALGREYASAYFSWGAYCKNVNNSIVKATRLFSLEGNCNG